MIRHDYPHLQKWLLNMYYDESSETHGAFRQTTYFDAVSFPGRYPAQMLTRTDQTWLCEGYQVRSSTQRTTSEHSTCAGLRLRSVKHHVYIVSVI